MNGLSNISNYFTFGRLLGFLTYGWRMFYYDHIKTIFSPHNKRIRKAIPRQYSDISNLIEIVNFKFVEVFYEDDYIDGNVDWSATEDHKEFSLWLEAAYRYIKIERPRLEEELNNSYPPHKPIDEMFKPVEIDGKKMYEMINDGIPYEVKYADVIRIEKQIMDKDTEILTEIIKRRSYFWS
jgi:hypothetical protein